MEGLEESIQKWATHFFDQVVARDNFEHDASAVLASFCAMRYINHGLCLLGYETSELSCIRNMSKKVK